MSHLMLYEAVKHGTDEDPYDLDTIFLVRAASVDEAASLVLPKLKCLSEKFVAPEIDVLYEVGKDLSVEGKPKVLRGPYVERAINHNWNKWEWSSDGRHWEACPVAENGLAEAFYDNGQKAAEIEYLDKERHGRTTRWYRDGQMMFCGEYVRGKRTGLHRYWFPDGGMHEEYDYFRGGVKVTRWLEDGRKMEEFTEQWKY